MEVDAGTELAQAYLVLKRQYDDLVSRNLAGVFRTTIDGRFLECNDAMAQLLGFGDREELMRHGALDLYYTAEDRDRFIQELVRAKRLINFEIRLKHCTGREVYVLENVFLDEGESRPATIQGTLIDITAFRRSQADQQALVTSYRNLIEHIRDGLLVVVAGWVRYANPAAEKMLDEHLNGLELLPLFHPEDREVIGRALNAPGTTESIRVRLHKRPEHELLFTCVETVHEGRPAKQVTLQDQSAQQHLIRERVRLQMAEEVNQVLREEISEHRRTQEALRRSRRFARNLIDSSLDMIMAADTRGLITEYNPAASLRFGYEAEEVIGLDTRKLYADPTEYARVQAELETHGAFTGEVRNVDKFGNVFTSFLAASRLFDENGLSIGAMGVSRDITRMKRDQEALRDNEAKLRALFESSEHMFWTAAPGVRLTSFNKAYADMIERLHGVRPKVDPDAAEPRRRFASDAYHDFWELKYTEAFSGKPIRFETDLLDKNGERVCNEVFLSPVLDPDGRVTEVFGVGHEITEQKEAEAMVLAQAARLKAIFESSANMMIWTLDKDMRITSCNEHFLTSIEQVHGIVFKVGDRFTDQMAARVAPERAKELLLHYASALRGKPQQFEVELIDLYGQPAWVENFLNPIIVNGQVREISCLAYGITDRVRSQRELEQSLSEKEVLLKEVHHRVKNNLQVISSIMNLQSAKVDEDPRLKEILHHSRDRIRSMSLIHESLYQNKQFSLIDMNNYVEGLARNLVMSYSLSGRTELVMDIPQERVYLVLDQAIPCGLILNELISNALKHAYPGDGVGVVRVSLGVEGERVQISVADEGQGMGQEAKARSGNSLGLELVGMLVGQLDGNLSCSGPPGVAYFLTFDRLKNNSGHGADERPRGGG